MMKQPFTNDRRIRVLHVLADGRASGINQYILDLCVNLPRDRFKVEMCFLKQGPILRMAEQQGLHTAVAGWSKPFDLRAALRFGGYIQIGEFDILHAHNTWRRLRLVAQRCGVRRVVHHLHAVPIESSLPYRRGGVPLWLGAATAFCDSCVVNSEFLRGQVTASNPATAGKVQLVEPGIKTTEWIRHAPLNEAKSDLNIPPDAPVVGTVARMVPVKRLDLFLELAAAVRAMKPNAVFLVCGDGPLHTELQTKAAALNLGDSLRLLGWRRDLLETMSAFDVLACTCLADVFPQTLFEAQAMGTPVVGFNQASVPGWVKHNETGLLVEPDNIPALRDAVVSLLDQPARRREMGQSAQKHCKAQFDLSVPLQSFAALYESLVDKNAR